jgi:DNA-binding response OmpR family regulator
MREATTMDTHSDVARLGAGWSDDGARRPRVLVVEDDGQLRRLMGARLRARGYDVVEAEDGVDLLGWMGSTMWTPDEAPIDAVVTDVNLPDMTALEVLAALRVRDAAIPIVLVTGVTDVRIHQEAYALGASAILTKPFDLEELGTLLTGLTAPAASHTEERS